ncbi:MAG TPA: TetR/AcrR family transcriptional regulator [Candidatus Limnocylindria bacterium]|nr:TetR/AcrR family transcriptional regulator [Candidatus Limnocylindria bacterium]
MEVSAAPRGRPRSEAARRAILSAALAAIRADGYGAVTVERIAQRAGVGKQTIYRWWRGKAEVVLDAVAQDATATIVPEHTDDPAADLRRFLAASFRRIHEEGADVLRGLVAEAQIDARFRTLLREHFLAGRRAVLRAVLARTATRVPLDLAVDFVFGAMWYRLLDDHAPLDDELATEIVRALLG